MINISPEKLREVRETFIRADIVSLSSAIKNGILNANRSYQNTYSHDIILINSPEVIKEVTNIFINAGFTVEIQGDSSYMVISW